MSKKKLRATTLSQRFGFKDNDLYEPTHDEIILALLDKKKMAKLLVHVELHKKFYPKIRCTCESINVLDHCTSRRPLSDSDDKKCFFCYGDWSDNREKGVVLCPVYQEAIKEYDAIYPCLENYFSISSEWVVRNDRNFEIGFIDLLVGSVADDHHTLDDYGGLIDIQHVYFTERLPNSKVYFEIKTKIDGFGATMRQLNMYRPWLQGPIVLLTLDDRFNDAFKDQGILVVGSEELRRYFSC